MSDADNKTLCAVVEEGLIDADPAAFIRLIRPATHYCGNCG